MSEWAPVIGGAFALFPFSERLPNESRPRLVIEAYFFMAFIMAAMAALATVLTLVQIAFWRPRRLEMSRERLCDGARNRGGIY